MLTLVVFLLAKSRDVSNNKLDCEVVPKVARMTVSGKKQTMGFDVPRCPRRSHSHQHRRTAAGLRSLHRDLFFPLRSSGDNGVIAAAGRRGNSPENTTAAPAAAAAGEAAHKRPETPSRGSNEDELAGAPAAAGRSAGKARQAMDVKAELEKRQGGKSLLNLVVIGERKWGIFLFECRLLGLVHRRQREQKQRITPTCVVRSVKTRILSSHLAPKKKKVTR